MKIIKVYYAEVDNDCRGPFTEEPKIEIIEPGLLKVTATGVYEEDDIELYTSSFIAISSDDMEILNPEEQLAAAQEQLRQMEFTPAPSTQEKEFGGNVINFIPKEPKSILDLLNELGDDNEK